MPTDEQRMREQFEADAKETLHWSTVSLDREELRPDEYAHGAMQYRWLGWQAAYRSRDAEVQALREALETIAGYEQRYVQEAAAWSTVNKDTVETWRSAYARVGAIARQGLEDNS